MATFFEILITLIDDTLCMINKLIFGWNPWLWEETHVPKVVSSNPSTVYWMAILTFNFVKIVMGV